MTTASVPKTIRKAAAIALKSSDSSRGTPWSRQDAFWILGIAISIFLFYPSLFFLKETILSGDYKAQAIPWAKSFSDALRQGTLAFWVKGMGMGFPLFAEGQAGQMYPLHLIAYSFLPFSVAYTYEILFHFLLSGVFTYLFCRQIGFGSVAAFWAAFSYLFGSAYGGYYYVLFVLFATAWFPLTLFLMERFLDRQRVWAGILLGVCFALELLGGFIQMGLYAILMSLGYLVIRWIQQRSERSPVSLVKTAGYLGIAFAIAFVLTFPQLQATRELVSFSTRVVMPEDFAYLNSLNPIGLFTAIFPRWESFLRVSLYLGLINLFFIGYGILDIDKKNAVYALMILTGIAFLLALGRWSPLFIAIIKITHAYSLRVPTKFLFFALFFLSIIAGRGVQNLKEGNKLSTKVFLRAEKGMLLLGALALSAIGAIQVILTQFRGIVERVGERWIHTSLLGKPFHPYSFEIYQERFSGYLGIIRDSTRLNDPFVLYGLLGFALILAWLRLARKLNMRPAFFLVGSFFLLAGDLWASSGWNIRTDFGKLDTLNRPPAFVSVLKQDPSLFRIYSFATKNQERLFEPNMSLLYGLEDIGAYTPLVLRRHLRLLRDLGASDDATGFTFGGKEILEKSIPLLSFLNVKYLISDTPLNHLHLKQLTRDRGTFVYQNDQVLPRFQLISKYEVFSDPEKIVDRMKGSNFNPSKFVLLEEAFVSTRSDLKRKRIKGPEKIEIKIYSDQELRLKVNNPKPAFLLATDTYYPGWKAEVDGVSVKIYRADYLFRAIWLQAGSHEVHFFFDRSSYFCIKRSKP